jgi:exopolysaccharide production protein ExoQ
MLLSLVYAAALPGLGWMPDDTGMRGAFGHKNILGWYASVSIVASAAVLAGGDSRGLRRLGGLVLVASALCLVASGSMTGLLSTIAAVCLGVFYAVLKRLQGMARTLFALTVLQLLAVAAVSASELLVPVLEALGKDATLTGRIPLWRLVDREIAEHLLFGVGYQAFWTEANPDAWAIWSRIGWPAPHAHNGYRDILLNFGLFGMAIFLVAILRAVVQGAALLRLAPTEGWLWLNVILGMSLVMNLTESLLLTQNDFLFIIFATALLMFGLRAPEVGRSFRPACGVLPHREMSLPA